MTDLVYAPSGTPGMVLDAAGRRLPVPEGWSLLPPGDAGCTRRVKAAGPHWIVQEKKGRKTFSHGIYAPTTTITRIQADLQEERATDQYAKKQQAAMIRRAKVQHAYVDDFAAAVRAFLNFAACHQELAETLVLAVTTHATPVGSGTVARTKRIPIEQRAEAAVIAWLRHQTTGYDAMVIPRVKGKRREIRRMLAKRSHELLAHYRQGEQPAANCPLQQALKK